MLEKALDESTSNRGKAWNRKLREVRAVLRETLRTEIKPAEVKRKDPTILSAAEVEKVMKLAVGEGRALPFALLLFAGIRPEGELTRLSPHIPSFVYTVIPQLRKLGDETVCTFKAFATTNSAREKAEMDFMVGWIGPVINVPAPAMG